MLVLTRADLERVLSPIDVVEALAEAGDLLIPLREGVIDETHVVAELAEVVGGPRPGRTSLDDVTVFKSVGFAIEDLAAAQLAYDRAGAQRIGKEVTL